MRAFERLRALESELRATRQAFQSNPENPSAHYERGLTYLRHDRPREALGSFDVALRLDPEFSEAFYGMGLAYVALDLYAEAEYALRKSIELRPDHGQSYMALGNLYRERGRIQEAIMLYKQASRLDVGSVNIAKGSMKLKKE
jgi:tetratricopeptide (TPR) repeat protein